MMPELTQYTFRRAALDDLLFVVSWARSAEELRYVFPRAAWPAETLQLVEHLASHEESFVVCDQNRVVGFANLYNPRAQKTWIGHFIVHPDHRRSGVAHFLISALQTIAKERYQSHTLATICFESNPIGLAFYQRLGFTIAGWETRLDHRGEGAKVFRLEKNLDEIEPSPERTLRSHAEQH
jgi:RimJ/RimL family protein N-acetyltransferase